MAAEKCVIHRIHDAFSVICVTVAARVERYPDLQGNQRVFWDGYRKFQWCGDGRRCKHHRIRPNREIVANNLYLGVDRL